MSYVFPVITHEPTGSMLCSVCGVVVEHRSAWEHPDFSLRSWVMELRPCGHRFQVTMGTSTLLDPEPDA